MMATNLGNRRHATPRHPSCQFLHRSLDQWPLLKSLESNEPTLQSRPLVMFCQLIHVRISMFTVQRTMFYGVECTRKNTWMIFVYKINLRIFFYLTRQLVTFYNFHLVTQAFPIKYILFKYVNCFDASLYADHY